MPLHMDPTSYGLAIIHGTMNTVSIGKYCSIADGTVFDGGIQHNTNFITTYPLWRDGAPERKDGMCKGDILIGNDVWIGMNCIIMSGVTIGDGAVIGAGSVIRKDVMPYTVVAGNPAKQLRYRFPYDQVAQLIEIAWWNWPKEKIMANAHLLNSEDLTAFIKEHG